ncbi:MAG: TonB-dependent receptor [Acidobacteriota bacterium]
MRSKPSYVLGGALALLVVVLAVLPSPACAQSQSAGGAISGTVSDASGAVLPGVTVTIKNQATGLLRTMETDAKGNYRALLLPIGTYEVSAALQGFSTVRRTDVAVGIGQEIAVDLALQLATQAETITVTAEAPIIETTRSAQASNVGTRAIGNLPVNGRNFIDFVLTTPGVTRDVRQGDISFAGQRGTLNSLVVDGADNNNTFFGQALGRTGSGRAPYQFSQDAVAEFQVNRNAYSAEYGRAGGAVINVVTKSGTNDYHGSAFWFYRDKSLNENSFANEIAHRPKSPYQYDQFGGSLGGPIRRDKAFFFVSYDGQRNSTPNDISLDANLAGLTIPTDADTQAGIAKLRAQAGSWQRGQNQDVALVKADIQFSESQRLSARYNRQQFTGQNYENGGPTNAASHTGDSLVNTDTLNLSQSSVFTSAFFNEARAQWARDSEPGKANSALPEATVRQGGRTILVVGRNFFSPRETTIDRWELGDVATYVTGNHAIKGGFDVLHDDIKNFFPGNFSGSYTFSSIAAYNRGIPDSYVQAFGGPGTTGPLTNPNSKEYAAFVQDEWRPRDNLTVTFGLRYDLQEFAQPTVRNPDPQLAAAGIDTSFLKTDRNNFGPRVGLTWNPTDKLVVRGGYGLFYGRTPAIMVGTAHSNNGINVQTITLTGNAVPTYPTILTAPPVGAAAAKPTIFYFDPRYQNPEVHQASLGADYALNDDMALAVSYLYVRGMDLQRSTDVNVGTPVESAIPVQGGGSVEVNQFPTVRPFSHFNRIIRFESTADSWYNGLTLELRRRFTNNLQYSIAYTLGKVEDTNPDATAVVPNSFDDAKFASDPSNFNADKAPGANDQRHRLVFSGLWDVPYARGTEGWRKWLLDGWSMSWIATAASGQPYSEQVTNDLNRDGNSRNDIVPGSRNSKRLPSYYNLDLRLAKRFAVSGDWHVELIAEAFNLFNRNNISTQRTGFYTYDATHNLLVPQAGFGQSTAAFDNRIVQLAIKLSF